MKKILIVDDSKSIQKAIAWRLERRGYQIAGFASDGDEGLKRFKELNPDLTILDITMPNRDGRECLREILKANPKAKVVMLSAVSAQDAIEECLKIGAIAFINKDRLMHATFIEDEIDKCFAL